MRLFLFNAFISLLVTFGAEASEVNLVNTRLTLEQKCLLVSRPGDILIISNAVKNKNHIEYIRVLRRTFGEYLPATLADVASGRLPFQFARHAGVIHTTNFNESKYSDISFVRNSETGLSGSMKTYTYEPGKRRSSGLVFTVIRPKSVSLEHEHEVFRRMDEVEDGTRRASWCSASVNDIHQGYFNDVLGFHPLQQLGEVTPSPTRLLFSRKAQKVCQYQQGEGVIHPASITAKDIKANIEHLRKIEVAQAQGHADQLQNFLIVNGLNN